MPDRTFRSPGPRSIPPSGRLPQCLSPGPSLRGEIVACSRDVGTAVDRDPRALDVSGQLSLNDGPDSRSGDRTPGRGRGPSRWRTGRDSRLLGSPPTTGGSEMTALIPMPT